MQYTNYVMKNNVFSELYAPISSLATTIQLKSGQGARRGTSFPILATLEAIESGKVTKREIVKITGISGDYLTVVRGFAPCPPNDDSNTQGTTTFSFGADDRINMYVPKEIFDKISDSLNDIYDNGVNKLRTEVVSGLEIKVGAGPVLVGSSYYDFEGDTITLTNNTTNYIEIDEDGNLVSNTSGRTLENTKIAKVVTSSGEVSSIEDWRLGTVGGKIGGTDIHELTEKDRLAPEDEFIIADSENIYQNKKVKYSNLFGIGNGVAVEDIDKGDFVVSESITTDSSDFIAVGFTDRQKIAIKRIGNGVAFDTIVLYASKYGSPTTLNVRIETDNNGEPSGTLINANAYGTVSGSSLSTSKSTVSVSLAGEITIADGTVCHIVLAIDTVSDNNFFNVYGYGTTPNLFKIQEYDGSNRGAYTEHRAIFSLSRAVQMSGKINIDQYGGPYGIGCSPDGKYVIDFGAGNGSHCYIRTLELSTPNLMSSATNTKTYDMGGYNGRGGGISSDGKTMIVFGNGTLIQYSLSTARDVSTASQVRTASLSTRGFQYADTSASFCIAEDGIHIATKKGRVTERGTLGSARNISSGSRSGWENNLTSYCYGILYANEGKDFYIAEGYQKYVSHYSLSTAYNISTATLTERVQLTTLNDTSMGHGMCFLPNGDFLIGDYYNSYHRILQYSDSLNYGEDILANITGNGLYNAGIGKADKTMTLPNGYIPKASIGDFTTGQIVKYNISYNDNKAGLTEFTKYYLGTAGDITDTANDYEVGIAIEPTILKLKQDY